MKHYRYSPSASKRWITCPGSKDAPSSPSTLAAEEGTLAHTIGEHAVRTGELISEDEELAEAIRYYLEVVASLRAEHILLEAIELTQRHSKYPEVGGTSDYTAIYTRDSKTILHVVDYKHGIGVPVYAEENFQMLTYASIFASYYGELIDEYRMTIVQPRCFAHHPVQHWSCSPERVAEHEQQIVESFTKTELVVGEHCRFCTLAATCPAMQDEIARLAKLDYERMETEDLARIFAMGPAIKSALKSVGDILLQRISAGQKVQGLKAVESRGHRKWIDTKQTRAAFERAGLLYDEFTVESIISPAQVEKRLKGAKELISGLVTRSSGVKLVSEQAPGEKLLLSVDDVFTVVNEDE